MVKFIFGANYWFLSFSLFSFLWPLFVDFRKLSKFRVSYSDCSYFFVVKWGIYISFDSYCEKLPWKESFEAMIYTLLCSCWLLNFLSSFGASTCIWIVDGFPDSKLEEVSWVILFLRRLDYFYFLYNIFKDYIGNKIRLNLIFQLFKKLQGSLQSTFLFFVILTRVCEFFLSLFCEKMRIDFSSFPKKW